MFLHSEWIVFMYVVKCLTVGTIRLNILFFSSPQTRTLLTGAEDSVVCLWSIEQSETSPVNIKTKHQVILPVFQH